MSLRLPPLSTVADLSNGGAQRVYLGNPNITKKEVILPTDMMSLGCAIHHNTIGVCPIWYSDLLQNTAT